MNDAYIERLQAENAQLTAALDDAWRAVLRYPFAQVCKHLIAANMLSNMEEIGFDVPHDLAKAVVQCDDDEALACPRLVYRRQAEKREAGK